MEPRTFARALRSCQTEAETRLWARLRDRRLNGWKFRRQVPIGHFVVDFLCKRAALVVEVDGSQHIPRAGADAMRTATLEARGYRVLRYWNNQVLADTENVLEDILAHLERRK